MTAWLRLTLITVTAGGGFTGVALTSQALLSPKVQEPVLVVLFIVFALLYVLVLVAGLLFVHDPRRTTPLVVALTLQIPLVSSPVIAYRFAAGFHATVGLGQDGAFAWLRLGSEWQFNLLQPIPWAVGINLIPIVLLAAMRWAMFREEQAALPPPRSPWPGA